MNRNLCESRAFRLAEADDSADGDIPVVLIDVGWGSSGYYSESVLKNAAKAGVFPAGTQMYLDHPGEQESYDRPERSVRDLAATLSVAGEYQESSKAVVSKVRPMGTHSEMLRDKEFLKSVGLSIRAFGDSTIGEAEGRKGQIITELTEAISVDFVTKAGRGGRVLVDLMESARPEQVVQRAIHHGVQEATANETRTALQDALTASYGGEKSWAWVRDFDEGTVWFQYETPDGTGTYEDSYEQDSEGSVVLGGSPVEVRAQTKYVPIKKTAESVPPQQLPANPAGETNSARETEESHMANVEIDEAELSRLRESAQRAETAESERDSARAALALRDARDTARTVITQEAGTASVTFSDLEVEGLLGRVSVGENGFDESAYRVTVKELAEKRAAEAPSSGIRGFGQSADTGDSSQLTERADAAVANAFGRPVLKGA